MVFLIDKLPTLYFWVVHKEHEAPAQSGGCCFCSCLNQVQCTNTQSLNVETSQRVLLLLVTLDTKSHLSIVVSEI